MFSKVLPLLLSFHIFFISQIVYGQCENGWVQCGNHCLIKVNKKLKWTDAKRHCEDVYDADLAPLIDSHINRCAIENTEGVNFWISLNDRKNEGKFLWVGRNEQISLGYHDWDDGEPNNDDNEDCVEVKSKKSNGNWNDQGCDESLDFLCSKCIPGLTGMRCDIDIDECASSPCQNGNECTNSLGGRLDWFECRCIEGHEGNVCERDCRPGPSDLLFLIDISSSQSEKSWESSLQYIKNFVSNLPIGMTDFQVAVATYSLDTKLLFSFNQYQNRSDLIQAISDLSQLIIIPGGPTMTSRALQWAEEALFNKSVGARVNEAFKFRYIFLLTDGLSTDRQDAIIAAQSLRNDVRLYVIGIGNQIAHTELFKLASKSKQPYVFSSENEAAVNRFWNDESDKECYACNATSYVDLLFLLDTSVNISSSQLHLTYTSVIHRLIDYLTDTHTDVHVALASYSNDVTLLSNFTDCIKELHSQSQNFSRDSIEGDTSRALFFSKGIFSMMYGAREDARKVIFLFSNGLWTALHEIHESARELYADDIELYVIVVDSDDDEDDDDDDSNEDSSDLDNVLAILKNPFNMFYVKEDIPSVLQVLTHTTRNYECTKRDFN